MDGAVFHILALLPYLLAEEEGGIFSFSADLRGELVHCLSDTDLKNYTKVFLYAQL